MAFIDSSTWRGTRWVDEYPVLIRKVKDPFGWMGNMSPHAVAHDGHSYRTTEALFQCLRVDDVAIREAIRAETSPMAAKFKAKAHAEARTVVPLSAQDLDNMRLCLRLKLDAHPALRDRLKETEGRTIIEDCSARIRGTGLFWGAAVQPDGSWAGLNWLGALWMELRSELPEAPAEEDPLDMFR